MHFSLDWIIIPLVLILVGFELRKQHKNGTLHGPFAKRTSSPRRVFSHLARLPKWVKVGALVSILIEPLAALGLIYSGIWIFVLIANFVAIMAFMGIIIVSIARMAMDEAKEPEREEKS